MNSLRRRIFIALPVLSIILLIANLFVFFYWFNNLHVHMICIILFYPLIFTLAISIYYQTPPDKTWHDVPIRIWLKSLLLALCSICCFSFVAVQLMDSSTKSKSLLVLECLTATLWAFNAYDLPKRTFRDQRAKHRAANNLCLTCGYDLRATSGCCPECGSPIP